MSDTDPKQSVSQSNADAYRVGDRVICHDYPGTVVREYIAVMFEIRLASGVVVVPTEELKRDEPDCDNFAAAALEAADVEIAGLKFRAYNELRHRAERAEAERDALKVCANCAHYPPAGWCALADATPNPRLACRLEPTQWMGR